MPNNLSLSDENLLLSSVKQAVEYVDGDGLDPNDAFRKVATERRLTPGMIRTACHAFNTGRQLSQWQDNENVLDKLAAFPLASADIVIEDLFGEREKKASVQRHDPFDPIPVRRYQDKWRARSHAEFDDQNEKAAEDRSSIPVLRTDPVEEGRRLKRRTKLAYDEARMQCAAAEKRLERSLQKVAAYFRQSAYDREPVAAVEFAARVKFGELATALLDTVLPKGRTREKRASDMSLTWEGFRRPVDYTQSPYPEIESVIRDYSQLEEKKSVFRKAAESQAEADTYFDKYRISGETRTYDTLFGPFAETLTKEAIAPGSVGNPQSPAGFPQVPQWLDPRNLNRSLGQQISRNRSSTHAPGSAGKPQLPAGFPEVPWWLDPRSLNRSLGQQISRNRSSTREAVQEVIDDFDDAEQINELRKIRAQTAIAQMISDPDNPLSSVDPADVLNSYNSLIHLAPSLADQPEALGPLLQKRIMGHTEPFEAAEALKLEESLGRTRAKNLPISSSSRGADRA